MTIRLRPHHLLCLLTYVGKGYSADFMRNYDAIAARLSAGENIGIVDGPDDICAPLLGDATAHCRNESVIERDRKAADDVGRLLGAPIAPGVTIEVRPELLIAWRAAFRAGQTRAACAGCEWSDLCTAIASDGFAGTLVN
ncbi:DUF1284 domain-containing protein [Devosia sp.]|uniref:DUF1284 domain-containing protein n=1 Tax=Devosia sp. TaxID=1871048 RepID=UPI001B15B46D|nr:DUF1284 domain-containing protein [Devosia sp.]MBO9588446.1 DUF1284 domain-containing protein [Devosia sp.]